MSKALKLITVPCEELKTTPCGELRTVKVGLIDSRRKPYMVRTRVTSQKVKPITLSVTVEN